MKEEELKFKRMEELRRYQEEEAEKRRIEEEERKKKEQEELLRRFVMINRLEALGFVSWNRCFQQHYRNFLSLLPLLQCNSSFEIFTVNFMEIKRTKYVSLEDNGDLY